MIHYYTVNAEGNIDGMCDAIEEHAAIRWANALKEVRERVKWRQRQDELRRAARQEESQAKEEANSSVDKKYRRLQWRCSFCPPHGGENRTRVGRHGKNKPKYKQHRRRR